MEEHVCSSIAAVNGFSINCRSTSSGPFEADYSRRFAAESGNSRGEFRSSRVSPTTFLALKTVSKNFAKSFS